MHVVPFGFPRQMCPAGNNRHPGNCLHFANAFNIFMTVFLLFFLSQALPPTVLECARPSASPTSPESEKDAALKNRKGSRDTVESSPGVIPSVPTAGNDSSKWNLTGTSEFTDSTQEVVNGGQQLHRLDEFIGRKIQTLDDSRGDADRVFLSALRELRGGNLLFFFILLLITLS